MVEILADVPPAGDYLSLAKVIFLLVLATPWFIAAPWVHRDSRKVRAPEFIWGGAVLTAGMLGLIVWILMPIYIVGLLVFIVLTLSALIAYVIYRNGRVPEDQKVLTGAHLSSLFSTQKKTVVKITTHAKIYTHDSKVSQPPGDEADGELRETYNTAQNVLYDMLYLRASEADISPAGQQARVRFVIDGVVVERPPLETQQSEAMIQYLKPIAGMNAEERRRPQKGKIAVDIANKPIDMMLTAAGTTGGQRIQFKVVQEFVQTQIELLGMPPDMLTTVRALTKTGNGVFIVSGRGGSGVTSTLYSLMRDQDAFIKQLVMLESKSVVDLENVTQNAYGEPPALANALASTLRRDPDVIMVDACEDPAAARQIVQAAGEKTFLLGVSAGDSFSALAKWFKVCGDDAAAAENLQGVLCQIMVRKLCPTCREAYRPDPKFLAKANMPAQRIDNFYRPPSAPLVDEKGQPYTCPTCHGNGYLGRTGVFELLEITPELRQMVAAGANATQLQAACRKNKMLYIQEQALRRVVEGVTSIQEVIRVTQKDKKA